MSQDAAVVDHPLPLYWSELGDWFLPCRTCGKGWFEHDRILVSPDPDQTEGPLW